MILRIQVEPPKGNPYEFLHGGPVVTIGRDPAAELHFDGPAQDNVSWEHARITLTDKAATLSDLGSTNGTFLNNSADRIKTCALRVGDVLRLGQNGPRLRILELALAAQPTVAPAEPRRPPRYAAAPAANSPSYTRQLLVQTQSRNRTTLAALSAIFLLLLLLIGTVIWLLNRQVDQVAARHEDTHRTVGEVKERQAIADKKLDELAADVRGVATKMDDFNEKQVKERAEDQKRFDKVIDLAVREAARLTNEAQADMRRMLERGQQPDPRKQPVGNLYALNKALGGDAASTPEEQPLEFKPGMLLSLRKRNSSNLKGVDYENIALVRITPESLILHLIEDRNVEIKMEDIETIFVKNQMYQFNQVTKNFESGVVHYRLDRSSATFARLPKMEEDLSLNERGETQGERNVRCFVHRAGSGLVLSLPKGAFGSLSFEAKALREIITNKGVYVWSDEQRDYVFRGHLEIAKELEAERQKKSKEQYDADWQKRVQAYQAVTERIRAARRYWWGWW